MSVNDHWSPPPVGGYRLLQLLGTGGFGSVYLGEREDGQRAAVKLLHMSLMEDPDARIRFKREIEHLGHVGGPDVVKILASDPDGPVPWIATEFIEGPTLTKAIRTEGPRSGPDLYRLALRTAGALAAIHGCDVIHRDFKPGNILLSPEGPRVIDFGISRFLESTSVAPSAPLGTAGYMAPEQLKNTPITTAVDIFTWGCVMVFAATGRSPFQADDREVWRHQVLHGSPETGITREPLLPIVLDCLNKNPRHRPTADELMRLLVRTHSSGGWHHGPNSLGFPPKNHGIPTTRRLPSPKPTRVLTEEADEQPSIPTGGPRTTDTITPPTEHPLAHVLARTVTDLVRAGLSSVPTMLLSDAHVVHLRGVNLPEDSSFVEELDWACRPVPQGGGLLLSVLGDHWRPTESFLTRATDPVPSELWFTAANHVTGEGAIAEIAMNAMTQGQPEVALSILTQATAQGDLASKGLLALIALQADDHRHAEPLLRSLIIETGAPAHMLDLGTLLHRTERDTEAEYWYLKAANSGSSGAMSRLAVLYQQQCEEKEAEGWVHRAAQEEDPMGMVLWSFDRSLCGFPEEARRWYDQALHSHGTRAFVETGDFYRSLGAPEAEDFYRAAVREGSEIGRERLREWKEEQRSRDAEEIPRGKEQGSDSSLAEPEFTVLEVPRDDVGRLFTDLFGEGGPWIEDQST